MESSASTPKTLMNTIFTLPRRRRRDDGQQQALGIDIARGQQQEEAVDALEQRVEVRLGDVEGHALGTFDRLAGARGGLHLFAAGDEVLHERAADMARGAENENF